MSSNGQNREGPRRSFPLNKTLGFGSEQPSMACCYYDCAYGCRKWAWLTGILDPDSAKILFLKNSVPTYAVVVQRKSCARGQNSALSVPSCVHADDLSFKMCVFWVVNGQGSTQLSRALLLLPLVCENAVKAAGPASSL